MPTQVQIRGASNATQQARTLASRELDIDTTNNRLAVHNGSTPGGIEHANFIDVQNNKFTYAAAAGTNTVTATFDPAPTARAAGQIWRIKAANTTTGAFTFNPNGLGAGTVYKKDGSTHTIVAGGANDMLQNGFYELMDIDGSTGFQLLDSRAGGLVTVKQGDLSTLTGSVSAAGTIVTLPGGTYGFTPQVKTNASDQMVMAQLANTTTSYVSGLQVGSAFGGSGASPVFLAPTYATGSGVGTQRGGNLGAVVFGSGAVIDITTGYAFQRYVEACPPYDIGDGEMMGFSYLKMDSAGNITGTYTADDPPWANNGPTDIRPTRVCPRTGQEYILEKRLPSLMDALAGAPVEVVEVPLTQKIKNADMKLIPHPFQQLRSDETVVLLDPMDERVRHLMKYQNDGGDIREFFKYIKPDNEALKRKQIKGVRQVSFKL